jgi:hypothetical protein
VIASHYAEPLPKILSAAATLHSAPSRDSDSIGNLQPGDPFDMLDNSVGWAWGYAGAERVVGYVRSDCLG